MRIPAQPIAAYDDPEVHSPTRLYALARSKLLDTPPEAAFDRITKLAAKLLTSETTLVSLVDSGRQFFKSQCGLGEPYATSRETPLSHSFCKHIVASKKSLMIADARKDAILATNSAVVDLGVISYLGVPITSPDGEVLGSLCAINRQPRDWSPDDLQLMFDLGKIVEDEIELRIEALRAATLAEQNAILAQEYHHRVKNALSVSAALVQLSRKDATSIDDLTAKVGGRLIALARAHDSLMSQSDDVDLHGLASRLLLPYCAPGSDADVAGPAISLRQQQVTPVCLFLHELATNAAKYGAFRRQSKVTLRWEATQDGQIILRWDEAGTETTQPGPAGFGEKLLATAAMQLHGKFDAAWHSDGLTVTLEFPRAG
ncbi:MAG: GAF domain-containing protein [Hyphomicrobium sp.]